MKTKMSKQIYRNHYYFICVYRKIQYIVKSLLTPGTHMCFLNIWAITHYCGPFLNCSHKVKTKENKYVRCVAQKQRGLNLFRHYNALVGGVGKKFVAH